MFTCNLCEEVKGPNISSFTQHYIDHEELVCGECYDEKEEAVFRSKNSIVDLEKIMVSFKRDFNNVTDRDLRFKISQKIKEISRRLDNSKNIVKWREV